MEIREMNIEEIEARKAEISNLLNDENCDVDALTAEVDALEQRTSELKEMAETRAKTEEIVNNNVDTVVIETIDTVEERKTMDLKEIRSSQEYVNAFVDYIKTNDDAECRALLSDNASSGGVVAVPTMVEDIVKHAWDKEGIMSLVKKTFIAGNIKVGFEKSATGAVIHQEGANAPSEEELVLGTVSIIPSNIKKWITISDEVLDLRGEAFLQYVYEELAYQIAKKAADTLVAKIDALDSTGSATAVTVGEVTASTITMGTIASAISALSDEAANPVIIMNKATWANFKAVQYANGYGADPFEGLTVLFNNSLDSFAAASSGDTYVIVGDLGFGAMANFPNGQEIKFIFDDKSLAEKDLVKVVGREYVGLGIVAPNAFVKIKK